MRAALIAIMISVLIILFSLGSDFVASSKENILTRRLAEGHESNLDKTVTLIIIDKVILEDLQKYGGPVLHTIMEQGQAALMNVNTAGGIGTEDGYLTIGSGARVFGDWTVREAYNIDEKVNGDSVGELYLRHTVSNDVPASEVLHLYTHNLWSLNEELPYPAKTGTLGEALQLDSLKTAVLGNADTDIDGRQAVSIVMNKKGVVDYGDVSSQLQKDDGEFPFGHRSDAAAYLRTFQKVKEEASLIAVEWGDTTRINDYMNLVPPEKRGDLLTSSLKELDIFLQGIIPFINERNKLIIVTPSPPEALFAEGQRLTPLVVYGGSIEEGGMLDSATTRRPGLVTNIDIAPTVIEHLEIDFPHFLWGAPLKPNVHEDHINELAVMGQETKRIYNQRSDIVKSFIITQIILLLGGLGLVIWRVKRAVVLSPFIIALYYFPVAVLLVPAFLFFPLEQVGHNILLIAAVTAIFTLAGTLYFRQLMYHLLFIGLLICSLLIFDLMQGADLIGRSFLGYDPVGGARFYGMGNEYMGLLLGSFILSAGSFFPVIVEYRNRYFPFNLLFQLFIVLYLSAALAVIWILASPHYGANFGGAVSAAVAFSVTLAGILDFVYKSEYSTAKKKKKSINSIFPFPRLKAVFTSNFTFCLLFIFMVGAGLLLFFLNVTLYGEALSHMGRSWNLVRSGGWQELVNIVSRKADMNITLIRYSLWSRLLLVFLALIFVLYSYPLGMMRTIFEQYPGYKIVLGGTVAGGIAAFMFNDSGVVAAATTMLCGSLPLLLFSLKNL